MIYYKFNSFGDKYCYIKLNFFFEFTNRNEGVFSILFYIIIDVNEILFKLIKIQNIKNLKLTIQNQKLLKTIKKKMEMIIYFTRFIEFSDNLIYEY